MAWVSLSNLALRAHPVSVVVQASEQRGEYRKSIRSKRKPRKRCGGTPGVAVNETSLPFRNPHPEASASRPRTKPGDALLLNRDLTIRLAQFWCQSRSRSGGGSVSG